MTSRTTSKTPRTRPSSTTRRPRNSLLSAVVNSRKYQSHQPNYSRIATIVTVEGRGSKTVTGIRQRSRRFQRSVASHRKKTTTVNETTLKVWMIAAAQALQTSRQSYSLWQQHSKTRLSWQRRLALQPSLKELLLLSSNLDSEVAKSSYRWTGLSHVGQKRTSRPSSRLRARTNAIFGK